jgi:HAD superfamily hydrolase (TIGR01450 family)
MPEPLRLAIVADIHHGTDKLSKRGSAALGLLDRFLAFVSDWGPDMVVDLGDRISDIDRETDLRLLTDVAARFAPLNTPRAHLNGNHDVAFMAPDENATALGIDSGHRSVDVKGWHLVFWQPDAVIPYPEPFRIRLPDLEWLAADLAATELPTVVFSHVPLSSASMVGNYWFANSPDHGGYPNAADARRVIEASDKVVLCVAGHVHWNSLHRVNAVPHITIQSLTESYTTGGKPSAAWATLEISDVIRWRTHGRDPIEMTMPVRARGERWPEPIPNIRERMARAVASTRAEASGPTPLATVAGLVVDLDGVLYRGMEPIAAGRRLMAFAREAGLPVAALTNNARRTADQVAAKLAGMGYDFPATRIVTAGYATARHVQRHYPGESVYPVGPPALRTELERAGVGVAVDASIVVAAIDDAITMAELRQAANLLRRGARLIVTNPDATHPAPDGFELETGAVQAFLETAGGRRAEIVVGKPNPEIFEMARALVGIEARLVLMVGDTPETDIAGACAAGMLSALVGPAITRTGGGMAEPTVRVASLDQLIAILPAKALLR